jgi:uncharacterized protein YpuA (DUF1002 family)
MATIIPPAADATEFAVIRFRLEIVEQQLKTNGEITQQMRDELRDLMVEIRTSNTPAKFAEIEAQIDAHDEQLGELRDNLQQARGAGRATLFWASLIAGLVGFAASALALWRG